MRLWQATATPPDAIMIFSGHENIELGGDAMHQLLRIGHTATSQQSGAACTVEAFLGGGSQGEVYRVTMLGQPRALKWYFPVCATAEQRAALEAIIKKGPPTSKFLWPVELAASANVPGFGYVMPLRDPSSKGIIDMMKRRVEPSFRALATAGFELADSYLQLHTRGMCYRDISFSNVFLNPDTGNVLICDNDNVVVDEGKKSHIIGTPRFMAPEIVRGEAVPSTDTDLFSLAILLFYMCVMHHPLEGAKEAAIRCLDLPAMTKLYGQEPIFIFDPDDDSNRPVKGLHDNALGFWPLYPGFLRDLFTRSFTAGIRDPKNGRVRESEWRVAMIRLRDSIIYCPTCHMENFYDADMLRTPGGLMPRCWSCQTPLQMPPRIRIGKNVVMLNHDTELFLHHVDEQRLYDFGQPIAAVTRHPSDHRRWGLNNRSADKWVAVRPDGSVVDVDPGRSVTLESGTRIQFGQLEGEIRA